MGGWSPRQDSTARLAGAGRASRRRKNRKGCAAQGSTAGVRYESEKNGKQGLGAASFPFGAAQHRISQLDAAAGEILSWRQLRHTTRSAPL